MNNKSSGRLGEDLAEGFLKEKGYIILERNYRHKRSEIDIITKLGDLIVFIEVKARKRINYGYPEEAVDQRKSDKIVEGAENYIFDNNWHGPIRFDIISVNLTTQKINHFEDAFG